jgi:pilus assembly protein Flp/PilA
MLALIAFAQSWLDRRIEDRDRGATAVEYGLLVGLIAVAIVGTLVALGPRLNALFQTVLGALPGGGAAA